MTDEIELSRRKVLAGLGTIGVASAGAGLGTSAYFSDEETFTNNRLVAGSLDLKVDWWEHYYNGETDVDVELTKNDPEEVPEDHVGLPDPEAPLIAVQSEDLDAFMEGTSLEAFPDPDDDAIPGGEDFEYDPCEMGADTPEDLDPTVDGALRTLDDDTVFGDVEDPEGVKPLIYLEDVKPGDFGEVTFSFHLCDNPGYVWMFADNVVAAENGLTEPEEEDPDEAGPEDEVAQGEDIVESDVELLDAIQTLWWYDTDGDNVLEEDDDGVIFRGSLRDSLGALITDNGIPLDGDRETDYDEIAAIGDETNEEYGTRECFAGEDTHYIGFAWWLPVDHANEIQTDSVEFDIGFYTEQCRHNDGAGMGGAAQELQCRTGTGFAKLEPELDGETSWHARSTIADNDDGTVEAGLAELDIRDSGDNDLAEAGAEYPTDGSPVDWQLEYSGGTATLTVDGYTVDTGGPEPTTNATGITAKARESGASVTVSDIEYNDTPIDCAVTASGSDSTQHAILETVAFREGDTLSGTVAYEADGASGEELGFRVDV